MRQPPAGLIIEDREAVVHARRTGGGGRVPALAIGALLLATVGIAFIGTKPPSSKGGAGSGPSAAIAAIHASASAGTTPLPTLGAIPTPTPTPIPTPTPPQEPTLTPTPTDSWTQDGLTEVAMDPTRSRSVKLPDAAFPLAGTGTILYFIQDSALYRVDIASLTRPTLITDAPRCGGIIEASAAGNWIIFVQAGPATQTGTEGCDGATPDSVRWQAILLDTSDLSRKVLLDKTTAAASVPPHVAIDTTGGWYAFSSGPEGADASGNPIGNSSVEVHAIASGKLAWRTQTDGIDRLQFLAGLGLLITIPPAITGDIIASPGENIAMSTPKSPDPRLIGYGVVANAARSGSVVVWQDAACDGLEVRDLASDPAAVVAAFKSPPSSSGGCIWQTAIEGNGPTSVLAWAPADRNYIGLTSGAWSRGYAVPVASMPMWLTLDGGILVWVVPDEQGALFANALDISSIGS